MCAEDLPVYTAQKHIRAHFRRDMALMPHYPEQNTTSGRNEHYVMQ